MNAGELIDFLATVPRETPVVRLNPYNETCEDAKALAKKMRKIPMPFVPGEAPAEAWISWTEKGQEYRNDTEVVVIR